MSMWERGDIRDELSALEGKRVCCKGTFIDVRVVGNGYTNLLFRGVMVNDRYWYDHLWIIYNEAFEDIGLKRGCTVQFDGKVKKYNNADRYGIAFCRHTEVMAYDSRKEDCEFEDINVQMKTVKYSPGYTGNTEDKGYWSFMHEYGMELKERCRLVYNPVKTMYGDGDIELDASGSGVSGKFSRVSFNPETDGRNICIDRKYHVKINETAYRKLTLLYFLVQSSGYGSMVYIPDEMKEACRHAEACHYAGKFMASLQQNLGNAHTGRKIACHYAR